MQGNILQGMNLAVIGIYIFKSQHTVYEITSNL